MRTINLLPKKPVSEKMFVPFLMLLLGTFLLAWLVIFISSATAASQQERNAQQIKSLERQIDALVKSRIPDARDTEFQRYTDAVQAAEASRPDWSAVMDQAAGALPSASRLLSMQYSEDNGSLTVTADFATMDAAAAYAGKLRRMKAFANVEVTQLLRREVIVANDAASVPDLAVTEIGNSGSAFGKASFYQMTVTVRLAPETVVNP